MEILKKIGSILLVILAIVGLYAGGKMLDIDVMAEFAPWLAVIAIAWVVYLLNKWFGLKLEVLNNAWVKSKVEEAIVYAEGKAVEKFKLNETITAGKDKLKTAVEYLVTKVGIDKESAEELIDTFFQGLRPQAENLWKSLAEEIQAKNLLMPPATE